MIHVTDTKSCPIFFFYGENVTGIGLSQTSEMKGLKDMKFPLNNL
jgi:hypothetical protein